MKINVLLCSHNGEKYIYDQIKSIVNQRKQLDNIFIFDFNSADNTISEINKAKSYCAENKIKTTIHIKEYFQADGVNKSFVTALNDIEEHIEPGDWLYICDQDDVWKPIKNEKIIEHICKIDDNYTPIIFHHNVEVVDASLKQISKSYYDEGQLWLLENNFSASKYYGLVIGHTICMNYSAVKSLSGFRYSDRIYMFDWYWGAVIEEIGKRVFIPEALSMYRQHDKNLIGANLKKYKLIKKVYKLKKIISGIYHQAELINEEVNIKKYKINIERRNEMRNLTYAVLLSEFRHSKRKIFVIKLSIIKTFLEIYYFAKHTQNKSAGMKCAK